MHKIKSKPGTYCILFRSQKKRRTRIGRWVYLYIEPGYYLYVGSAFGPGGILSRVLQHCRKSKAKHWHMDYLREFVTPVMASKTCPLLTWGVRRFLILQPKEKSSENESF